MVLELIHTEGYALQAEIKIAGQRLYVMDDISRPEKPASPGMLSGIQLGYFTIQPLAWDAMFTGNPDCRKRLEHQAGWRYLGYGQITSILPTVVDFGLCTFTVPEIQTHDTRCVAAFVVVALDRLELSFSQTCGFATLSDATNVA